MYEQLGIRLHIEPAHGEVRSMRGIHMRFDAHPGLCRKTRQNIPAAIRRAMEEKAGNRLAPARFLRSVRGAAISRYQGSCCPS